MSDLYSSPHDQVAQQLRLTIETIKERQESELVNSPEYGLLSQVTPEQTIQTLGGAPTPDDLDALITKVWKTPSFFLTHPQGVAAFGREATYRGVPPPVVSLFGAQFITWRGIPLIPSDKVPVEDGKTKFILVRTGEERQGVVGLFQPGLVGEQAPGLVGAVHRHQPVGDRDLPGHPVHVPGCAHRRRACRARRRRCGPVP